MTDDSFPREQHNYMVSNKRYGKLTIQYEAGRVTTVRKEETIIDKYFAREQKSKDK